MKKAIWVAALGGTMALGSCVAFAQAGQPATGAAAQEEAQPAIPVDQQATKEQVARLFEVMRIKEQMNNTFQMMSSMARQQVGAQTKEVAAKTGGKLTPEQEAAARKTSERFMARAMELFPVDEMIADMIAIYQRHFTGYDVEAITAFYSTDAGQHMLTEQPAVMREYMPVVMKRMTERTKQLTDDMTREMQDALKNAQQQDAAPEKK